MKEKTFIIESCTENLRPLRERVSPFLKKAGMSPKDEKQALVCIIEACTNSIRHAYGNERGRKIRVSVRDMKDRVVFTIRDYGKKIDLTKIRMPVLPPVEPGGLGIYFMKTFMNEMQYNTAHAKGTELVLVKYKKAKTIGASHEGPDQG